jgi:hypothetical protein
MWVERCTDTRWEEKERKEKVDTGHIRNNDCPTPSSTYAELGISNL